MTKTLNLFGQFVEAGEYCLVKKSIGLLPSGNHLDIQAHVYRAKSDGPVLLLTAGMHGDEVNGIELLRRAVIDGLFHDLQIGSVILIPIINVFGFINFNRDVPDGKDINRSFPGSKTGSLASRVAHEITANVIPIIDYGIDFHTGGATRYNYPQVRYQDGLFENDRLVEAFGAEINIHSKMIPKSFRKTASDRGKSIIVFEGGESLRYDQASIDVGLKGIANILSHFGMKLGNVHQGTKRLTVKESGWIRASRSGLFLWVRSSGQHVQIGDILGYINDAMGQHSLPIKSDKTGIILGHNNVSVVIEGDALFHIGLLD